VFFLFGFGTTQQDLGPGEVRTCPNCGNTRTWARVRESRRLTVFFVPVARWGRKDLEVCPVCGVATEV
jgi:rRNA maturation protein Nop10